ETAGSQASQNVRVIRLPVTIVALADEGIGDGVQGARLGGAGALIEIARILFQKGRQDGGADEGAVDGVGITGAEALAVALCALTISGEVILRLLNSGNASDKDDGEGIENGLPGKLELLPRVERCGIGDVGDIEIGKNAEDTLLLLNLDLLFGNFGLRESDLHVSQTGSNGQRVLRERVDLPRTQGSRECLIGESGCGDGEMEGAGRDVGERELAVVGR